MLPALAGGHHSLRSPDRVLLHFQAPLRQLEAAAGNLLGQLGALCAEQLRKATILQGMYTLQLPSHEHIAALAHLSYFAK